MSEILPKGFTLAEDDRSALPKGFTLAEDDRSALPKGFTLAEDGKEIKDQPQSLPITNVSPRITDKDLPILEGLPQDQAESLPLDKNSIDTGSVQNTINQLIDNGYTRDEVLGKYDSMGLADNLTRGKINQVFDNRQFEQATLVAEKPPKEMSMLELIAFKAKNIAAGAAERAGDLGGALASTVQTVGEGLEKNIPLGGFVWEEGDILPSYQSAGDFKETNADPLLGKAAKGLKDSDFDYKEQVNWQQVKDEFSNGGALSASAYGNVIEYGLEQGFKSIPDMGAALFALPTYIFARSGEIGDERAKNKGKEKADVTDILEAAPFAVASSLLERIGARGITQAGKEELGAEMLKAGIKESAKRTASSTGKAISKEAATEAAQEGMIEYVGERFGTDAALSWTEALDRAAAGAVAGGVMAGATSAPIAAGREIAYSPEKEIAKAMNEDIDNTDLSSRPADTMQSDKNIQQIDGPKDQPVIFEQGEAVEKNRSAEFKEGIQYSEQLQGPEPKEDTPTKQQVTGKQVVEAPIDEITISKDVPQFKDGANLKGVVEPLGGKFERTGVSPIQIWVRSNGDKEVISGRHRLDLARRSGEESIPAQYHYEDEGFNSKQAAALDATLNIREGQGKVKDYVDFIQSTDLTKEQADEQGILARQTGKRAFTIATDGTPALIIAHRNDKLTDEAASRIADAAPNSEKLQAVGIKAIQDGKTISVAENLIKAVKYMADETGKTSDDLFGFDDSAMIEAENLAKKAVKKQTEIQRTLSAIQGATKRPDLAAKEGVDVKNPEAVKARIESLKADKRDWQNWHTNPSLVAELKGEDFNLTQETEGQRQEREKQKAIVKKEDEASKEKGDRKIKADKEAGEFTLTGSDRKADIEAAGGQTDIFSSKKQSKAIRGVNEKDNVSPLKQEFLNSKKPEPKGKSKSTATEEVGFSDGVLYSRTFTQKQKLGMEPNENNRPPLEESNALDEVSNLKNDKAMPNNPPSYADLERSGSMPERQEFFMLRGKKIKNSDIYKSQKREGIIASAKGIMGNRLYHNRIKGKTVAGYYNTINGELRVKKYGDIETLAHEMAHYLDFYHKDGGKISKIYSLPEYSGEVESFSYTSDPELKMIEGYAEYMRAWLTNYDFAKSNAPKFTLAFERYLHSNKPLKNKMLSLQIKMHRWYLQGDKARAMEAISGEKIGSKSLTLRERAEQLKQAEIASEFKTGVFDYLHPAKVMSREIKGKLSEGVEEPYKLLQLLHGADQIFAESYQRGAPYYKEDGSLDFKGISLADVWERSKKAGNERMKDQELYFASMRAQEARRKGTEKLFTPGMIKEGLALANKYPYFKQAFEDFQKFNKSMLQFYVDSGYISKDSMDAFIKNNTAYVAFHRAVNTRSDGATGGSNIGAKQTGAEESVLHIYQNTLKQTGIHLASALKARAMRTLYEQALTTGQGGAGLDKKSAGSRFITKATTDVKPITVDAEQIAKTILQKGTENEIKVSDLEFTYHGKPVQTMADLVEYLNANPDLLKFWSFGQPPKDRRTDFDSYIDRNGDTKWIQINEDNTILPMMIDALNGLNLPKNEYVKAAAKLPLIYKNFKTMGITSAWQFAGGNIIRDSSTAMALSGFKFKPVYSHLKGLAYMVESIWNTNGLVGELRGNGGYSGGRVQSVMYDKWGLAGSNTEYLSGKAWYKSPVRITQEMVLAYTKLADITEMMTRVGFYAEQRASGVDPTEAAWQTRQITTDFQKHGSNPQLAYVVRTSAFLNAGMQGSMRELEAIFEVNGEMKLSNFYKDESGIITINSLKTKMYGVMMLLAGVSMMSAYLMLNSDDEDERDLYKNLTPDERSRFIHLPGGTKLPKPIGVFGFSMAMSEIAINDALTEKEESVFVNNEILFAMGHHLALTGSPSIAQLPLDFISGEDWKGAPIVPNDLKDVKLFQQYNSRTGIAYVEAARTMKEKFGIEMSPIQTEYVVKNTTGYYSEYIKEYTDRLFWDYEAWGERPFQKSFTDISFRQFKKDQRIFRNKYTTAYYELYGEALEMASSSGTEIKQIEQGFNRGGFSYDSKEEQLLSALATPMAKFNKAYKEWGIDVIISDRNPKLSGKEKEEKHIRLFREKNKAFEIAYKEFKKELNSIKKSEGK